MLLMVTASYENSEALWQAHRSILASTRIGKSAWGRSAFMDRPIKLPPCKWEHIRPMAKMLMNMMDSDEVRENVIRAIARADSCYYHRDRIPKEDKVECCEKTYEGDRKRYILQNGQAVVFNKHKMPAAWVQLKEYGKLVIGIRQTIDAEDWKTNRNWDLTNLKWGEIIYGKVHTGFYNLAKDLVEHFDEIIQHIRPYSAGDMIPLEIHIGGFSQGAAVAFLVGFFLQVKYPYLNIKFALVAMPPLLDEEGAGKVEHYLDYNNINFYVLSTPWGRDGVYGAVKFFPLWEGKYRPTGILYEQKVPLWNWHKKRFCWTPFSVHDLIQHYYDCLVNPNFRRNAIRSIAKR